MTDQNNAAQAANKELLEAFELTYAADAADPACAADLFHFTNGWRALLSKLRAPVADESPMAKMADALREKARQEQQAYQDRRNQATEWGPMPEGTEADRPIPIAPVAHVAGDETSRYLEWAKDRSAWEMPVGTPVYYAALASAPVAGEAQQPRRLGAILSMDGATLHVQRDGSAQIIVAEDDFTLEDDRNEGPDGPQGSVHWVARLAASELTALRDFLTGHARPSDDTLWDQTLSERDEYHDMADKLANAIADHLMVEIGEHSSGNCPWMRALRAIENAAPQASAEAVRNAALEEAAHLMEQTGKRIAASDIRALKQPQASQDVRPCSCPSGDGSLRHPCAVHPPADTDKKEM